MSDELWEIEELTLPEGVQDISDLTRFAGLKTLTIQNAAGLDLSVLPQLTTLKTLDLSGTTPDLDAGRHRYAAGAQKLVLQGCAVTAINPLVGLSNLEYLDLTNNSVSDLTAITALEHLKDLYLTNNPVKSITYLNSCLELERLHDRKLRRLAPVEPRETLPCRSSMHPITRSRIFLCSATA